MNIMRVAIQGEAGSFHHEAAKKWFGSDVEIIPAETFSDVFGILNHHEADTAVIAVENSLYGSINTVLDLIEKHHYPIVGEVLLRIEQQLISLPGVTFKDIEHIYSHPVALAQCEAYLDKYIPQAERIEYHDTASSVELIKELGSMTAVAIAGRGAAKLHNLPILSENIEDNKENFTRFLVLDSQGNNGVQANKASLVLTTPHQPGALAKVLSVFATAGANLTKLESRPIIGTPWRYRFYIDVEINPEQFKQACQTIEKDGATITVLGQYTAATI
jgi:prephenate dehydratase